MVHGGIDLQLTLNRHKRIGLIRNILNVWALSLVFCLAGLGSAVWGVIDVFFIFYFCFFTFCMFVV